MTLLNCSIPAAMFACSALLASQLMATDADGPTNAQAPIAAESTSGAQAVASPAAPEQIGLSAADRLEVGKHGGFFQPSALIQIWGQLTHVDGDATTTGFRLRRVELRAKGEVLPGRVSYLVAFDVAKTPAFTTSASSVPVMATDGGASPGTVSVPTSTLGADRSVLQDVYITYLSPYADVSAGQFKIPISLEALQSSSNLLFPERARVSREYGDRRDIGLRVSKKIGSVFYYYAGIFNGSGQNALDNDRAKDVGLRLEAYPLQGLTVAGATYGTIGSGSTDTVRNRVEGDLRLELANLIVQGEYIHGWTGPKERRLEGQGYYGAIGYTIAGHLQPVARVGYLDINMGDEIAPRTEAEGGAQRQFEAGLNYLVNGSEAKITGGLSYYLQEHGRDVTELTIQTQLAF